MATNQQQRAPGTPTNPAGPATTEQAQRKAPASGSLLKDLEVAAQRPQKESFQQKKNRILERCGCL